MDTMKSEESREVRKRKLELRESELSFHNQLKSPRLVATHDHQPENSTGNSTNTCESTRSSDRVFASCGSSNFTSNFVDLEEEEDDEVFSAVSSSTGHSVEFSDCVLKRDQSLAHVMETRRPSDQNLTNSPCNFRRTNTTASKEFVKKMPSDDELEEFFTAAEKDLQKKFIDKYNYDIDKDEPLQGRYEWVQISKSPEAMNTKK